MMLWFAIVTWGLVAPGAVFADPVEWETNAHWYEFVPELLTWPEAEQAAESTSWKGLVGHLATVTSQAEQDFVTTGVPGFPGSQAWLGGYQHPPSSPPDENWYWITGEAWDYTFWGVGEPNDHGEPGSESYLIVSSDFDPPAWSDAGDGAYCYMVEYEYSEPIQWAGNGHWYQFVSTILTWPEAWDAAGAMSWMGVQGHLATITSQEELDFVRTEIEALVWFQAWLGGYQDPPGSAPDQNRHWITCEPWAFTAWGLGEPNDHGGPGSESYLILSNDFEPAAWADAGDGSYRYLVEFEETPSSASPTTWSRLKSLFLSR
jgi:hypothetical protein